MIKDNLIFFVLVVGLSLQKVNSRVLRRNILIKFVEFYKNIFYLHNKNICLYCYQIVYISVHINYMYTYILF